MMTEGKMKVRIWTAVALPLALLMAVLCGTMLCGCSNEQAAGEAASALGEELTYVKSGEVGVIDEILDPYVTSLQLYTGVDYTDLVPLLADGFSFEIGQSSASSADKATHFSL